MTMSNMFWRYLQGWRLHSPSGKTLPMLIHSHNRRISFHVHTTSPVFQFVTIASDPVTGQHWKKSISVFYGLSLQVLMRSSPKLLFSRLNSGSSSLSHFSQQKSSSPFIIFMIIFWTLFSMSMTFLYQGAQSWTQHSWWGLSSVE